MTVNICRIISFEIRNEPAIRICHRPKRASNQWHFIQKHPKCTRYKSCPCTRSEGV